MGGGVTARALAIAVCAALAGCGAEGPAVGAPERVVTFGHSFVQGRYPDRTITPWPDRVAAHLGAPLSNRGVGGSESPAIAARVDAYEPRAGDVVVVEAALNDVRHLGRSGLPRYRRSLTRILERLTRSGERPRVAILIDPPIVAWKRYPPHDDGSPAALAEYGRATRALAARHHVRVIDLGRSWDPSRYVASDGVHPNEAGTERIATLVEAAVG